MSQSTQSAFKARFEKAKQWLDAPLTWIVFALAVGLVVDMSKITTEFPKMLYGFSLAMLVVAGTFRIQGAAFGSTNSLAQFMELLTHFMDQVRDPTKDDPTMPQAVALLAMGVRNAGTLIASAIIIFAVFQIIEPG